MTITEIDDLLNGLHAVVQYRRKDGGHGWITMAAFDTAGPAESYYEQQRKSDTSPWEYRWFEIVRPALTTPERGPCSEIKKP